MRSPADDPYDEKRDQPKPKPVPAATTTASDQVQAERRKKEKATEVVLNLGGSFIAPGSLAKSKPANIRGLGRVQEEEEVGGSVDVDMNGNGRKKGRLNTVHESRASQPDDRPNTTTTHTNATMTTTTAASQGDDSYMAQKMSHIMTNERAFKVLTRIEEKLAGTDRNGGGYTGGPPVEVEEQVQYLIEEATKHENLAQGESGESLRTIRQVCLLDDRS